MPGKSHGWRCLVGYSPCSHKESDTTERLHFHFSPSCIGEGNGNPLQCSCLQNPRDGGAPVGCRLWGRTESDTTERLSSGRYKEGFPQWLSSTESACEAGDKGSIPGSGRSPGVGNVSLLQYSCLENPLDRGAWWATAHKSRKGSDTTERLSTHAQGMCTTDVR